jgi:hypothetical protein
MELQSRGDERILRFLFDGEFSLFLSSRARLNLIGHLPLALS